MLKKILIIGLVAGLTGCATHQQSNELAGAAVGGIIGNAVGGRGGAAVGAVLGAAVGGSQPTQAAPTVVYRERQIVRSCQIYVDRERSCYQLRYRDTRAMCIEDAREHYYSCMSR